MAADLATKCRYCHADIESRWDPITFEGFCSVACRTLYERSRVRRGERKVPAICKNLPGNADDGAGLGNGSSGHSPANNLSRSRSTSKGVMR